MEKNISHAFHGLSAYSGLKKESAIMEAAERIQRHLKEEEICCADRPIGRLGVVVAGSIRKAWDRDVWSEIDGNGKRYALEGDFAWSIDWPDDDRWHEFAIQALLSRFVSDQEFGCNQDVIGQPNLIKSIQQAFRVGTFDGAPFSNHLNESRHYCEAWMQYPYIVGVWLKDWANESDDASRWVANRLAYRFRVPLYLVKGRTRIWELHGSLEIRAIWRELIEDNFLLEDYV